MARLPVASPAPSQTHGENAPPARLPDHPADEKTDRGNYANEVLLGPSLQFRPVPNAHIDIAPLFGLTDESPDAKVTLLFGWEF